MTPTAPGGVLALGIGPLRIEDVAAVAAGSVTVQVAEAARRRVRAGHEVARAYAAAGRPVYGLTTGLGAAADTPLDPADVTAFQARVLRGRGVGLGPALPRATVRAMMLVRAAGLAQGASGASEAPLHALVAALNAGLEPVVPAIGSIGAADLAPLAHLGLALTGEGTCLLDGRPVPAAAALAACGLAPLRPGLKDGHALVGGNALSVGAATLLLAETGRLLCWMEAAIALHFTAFRANPSVLDARALALRPAPGVEAVAARLRALLGPDGLAGPDGARRLQDPLSFRCGPQVLAAFGEAVALARAATEAELTGAGDNPAVLADADATGAIVSNGNFDLTHFVLRFEMLAQAMAQAATAAAWRCFKTMSPGFSDLPRFLTPLGGSRTGFATVQKTVAALEARIRHRALPVSLAPLPVADGVEDHAGMAPAVVDKAQASLADLRRLAAIELVVAAQALALRPSPHLGPALAAVLAFVRTRVPPLEDDRPIGPDLARLEEALATEDPG